MRKLVALFLLASLVGCASETPHGQCIGFWEKENQKLEYEVSKRNVIVGIVFIETVFVPVLVALNQGKCPTGPKEQP